MAISSRILGPEYTDAQAIHPRSFDLPVNLEIKPKPLHTLYGGAHLFRRDSLSKIQKIMQRYRDTYLKSPESIAILLTTIEDMEPGSIDPELFETLFSLLRNKIETMPIEDYRIDFEDGYGYHSDSDEDATAISSAQEAALAFTGNAIPPFFGFRIKSFSGKDRKRALNTLDLFLGAFLDKSSGKLPDNFLITLPKIETLEEIESFNETLSEMEFRAGLKLGTLKTELMIEEPKLLYFRSGVSQLPEVLAVAGERCQGLHIGIYDYLSSFQVPSSFQTYTHPLVDDLRIRLLHVTHGTEVAVVDGVTNILPTEPHRKSDLTANEMDDNMGSVFYGWNAHYRHVTHSLKFGISQGWDIHPAQTIARYIAVYKHLLETKPSALDRMKRFSAIATKPNQSGGVFDDAATVRGLLVYFKRALSLGIVSTEELEATGLSKEQLLKNKIEWIDRS